MWTRMYVAFLAGLSVLSSGSNLNGFDNQQPADEPFRLLSSQFGDSPAPDNGWHDPGAMVPSHGLVEGAPLQDPVWPEVVAAEQKPVYCGSCGKGGGICACCCHNDVWARWTASAGWLYMKREAPASAVLFSNPLAPAEAIDAGDFNFDFRSGFELAVTRHNVLWCWDVEARFFSLEGWSDTVAINTTGPATRIHTAPPIDLAGRRDVTSTYSSDLRNFELNLRRRAACLRRWRWLAGFRYMELDEYLFTSFASPVVPGLSNGYRVVTQNRLYGLQIGGDLDVWSTERFCLRGSGKFGIFGNTASNHSRIGASGPPPISFLASESGDRASFIGEVGLSARYCCGRGFALRADYRAMWVDGVAVASDQLAGTSFLTFSGVDTSGGALYHGLFLGAEFSF